MNTRKSYGSGSAIGTRRPSTCPRRSGASTDSGSQIHPTRKAKPLPPTSPLRLPLLLGVLLLSATPGPARAGTWKPNVFGVIRRQDLARPGAPDLNRFQFQLRAGAIYTGDDHGFELRLSTGPDRRPNLSFFNTNDSFKDQDWRLDRVALRRELPGGTTGHLGRVGNPHWGTQLLFDNDVAYDGLSLVRDRDGRRVSLLAAQLTEGSYGDLSTGLVSGQIARDVGRARLALAYHRVLDAGDLARAYDRGQLAGFASNRRFFGPDRDLDGNPDSRFASDFRFWDLMAQVPVGRATATLNLTENKGADARGSSHFLQVDVPEVLPKTTFTLRAFRVEREAALADYLAETFHGTNRRGFHMLFVRPLSKNTKVRAWWTRTLALDALPGTFAGDIDEVRIDWVWKF